MDKVSNLQHKGMFEEWIQKPLWYQMGNIGSEVSRSLKNVDKPGRFVGAYERALELFDFTIEGLAAKGAQSAGALREVCRAREEFCDYFDENEYHTDPAKMQRYYDQFVMLGQ